MKWKKAHCEKISKSLRSWQQKVGLAHWNILLVFEEKDHADRIQAEVQVKSRYKNAQVTVYPEILEMHQDHWHRIMLHELCHVLVSPLMELIELARREEMVTANQVEYFHEQVAVDIENALIWCYKEKS